MLSGANDLSVYIWWLPEICTVSDVVLGCLLPTLEPA